MRRYEHRFELFIFNSRRPLAPFYVGLIAGIGLLLIKFFKAFVAALPEVFTGQQAKR